MDELQVIRNFHADAATSDRVRRVARDALIARIEAAGQPRRWPRLAVVLAAVALAAVMAASALALYDFIEGDPAPPDVTRLIVEEGTAERLGGFFIGNPQAAHGVAALETTKGRVLLWAAPTAGNAFCYFLEFETLSERSGSPKGQANCAYREPLSAPARTVPINFVLHRAAIDESPVAILVGWTHDSIESVSLRSPEGDERELTLLENFFLAEIPADQVPKDSQAGEAYEVLARDRTGNDLGPASITEYSGLRLLNRFPKVSGPKRTVIETTDSFGRPMRLSLIPLEGGQTSVELSTRNGTSHGWGGQQRVEEGIQVHPTLMGSIVFLNGSVGPEVAVLELHHQDGYVVELPIVERFVLHGIPRARFEDGKRPIRLVARNRDGAEVAREKVGQRVFGPDSAIWSGADVGP
jgi:hypothetical protein